VSLTGHHFLDTRSSSEKNEKNLGFVTDPPQEGFNAAPNEYSVVVIFLVLALTTLFFHGWVWGPVKTVAIAVMSGGLL
jgi:hypothetical protein